MASGELRESVALLVTEWRVLALALAGPVVYGTWVVASGLVLEAGAPALRRAVATTVAGTPIRGLEIFALLSWIVLPALVAIALVQRQLFNRHDNLANYYRLAEPGVLLVVPTAALVCCLAALVVSGWSLPLAFALLVVTVHFLVRTAAFGHRVYTLSATRTLLGIVAVSMVSIVVGLLVRLPAVAARDPRLASRVATIGVADAVGTWTTVLGVEPTLLPRGTLFVPIVLSVSYLLVQTTVASIAKLRGLPTAPERRPGQRVPESAQPSAATSATRVVSGADSGTDGTAPADTESEQRPDPPEETDSAAPTPDGDAAEEGGDDHTGTRVFTPNEPVPPADGDTPATPDAATDIGPDRPADGSADQNGSAVPTFEGAGGPSRGGSVRQRSGRSDAVVPRFETVPTAGQSSEEHADTGDRGAVVPVFESTDGTASGGHAEVDTGGLSTVEPTHTAPGDHDRSRADAETVIAETTDEAADTVAGGAESADADEIDCPSCGRRVSNDADICYCPGCGTALETDPDR